MLAFNGSRGRKKITSGGGGGGRDILARRH